MPIQTAIDSISNSQGSPFGFKNRIINGAMVIDQRNAGASVTPASGAYTLDRWQAAQAQAGKFTVQQNAGSVTPPPGFVNYLGITSTSAYSILSTDTFTIRQIIEGYNVTDLAWGTGSAQPITISFWVRSSLTGTFGGSLGNNNSNRSYPFAYTIISANTWEYKTVTIPGDTVGTIPNSNAQGLYVIFGLGVGSSNSTTAGAWNSGFYYSSTGATSVVGTNGATFYITGVQLEKGSTATSFDYRDYGRELAMCQRYYVQTASAGNNGQFWDISGRFTGTTQCFFNVSLPVSMRAQPSISITPAYNFGGGWYSNLAGISNYAWTAAPVAGTSFCFNVCNFYVSMSTVSAGTVGLWADPYCPTTASANYFAISAEL